MEKTIEEELHTLISGTSVFSGQANEDLSAFSKRLAEKHLVAGAVFDGDEFRGFVDVFDIAVKAIGPKKDFERAVLKDVLNASQCDAGVLMTKKATIEQLLDTMGTHRQPRVALVDGPKALHVLTQTDVMLHMFAKKGDDALPPAVRNSTVDVVFDCIKTPRSVLSVPKDATAIEALSSMREAGVHAVGVVDTKGEIVANFSTTDLRGLTAHNLKHLEMPVMAYLDFHNRAFFQGVGDAPDPKIRLVKPLAVCHADTLLDSVVDKMRHGRLHRIWVVDRKHRPINVISTADILKFLHFALGMGKNFF